MRKLEKNPQKKLKPLKRPILVLLRKQHGLNLAQQ